MAFEGINTEIIYPPLVVSRKVQHRFAIIISVVYVTPFIYPVIKDVMIVEVVKKRLSFVICAVDINARVNEEFRTIYVVVLPVKTGLAFIIFVVNVNT